MERTEIRIAGFGGQGVVLAGMLLGRAAVLYDGKQAIQTQSYGAEARGGAARSEVILWDRPIVYPKVLKPDLMTALSQVALDKYVRDLKPGGTLILDADLVERPPQGADAQVYEAPFSKIATEELGRAIVGNMVMLGFMVGLTKVVSEDALRASVRTGVPKGTEELNLRALEIGMNKANP